MSRSELIERDRNRFAAWRGTDAAAERSIFTTVISTVVTFVFVMLGFTFTRSANLGAAADAFLLMVEGGW